MFKRGRNRLVNFKIKFTKQASIDVSYLKRSNLKLKAKKIIEIIKTNSFSNPPPFEKLVDRFAWNVFKKNKYPAQNCLFS